MVICIAKGFLMPFQKNKPEKGKEDQYEKLRHNIDPNEQSRSSYVKKTFSRSPENSFRDPDKPHRIHDDDKAMIKNKRKRRN